MSMQDKDMDQLFRTRLAHLEVEPSASVWNGIAVELNKKKKKNTLMPVIRMAASITVFLAAGLFFLFKDYKLPKNQTKNDLVKNQQVDKVLKAGAVNQQDVPVSKGVLQPAVITRVQKHSISRIVNDADIKTKLKTVLPGHEVITAPALHQVQNEQQVLAAVTTKTIVDQPVVPEVPLTVKNTINDSEVFTTPVNVADIHLPLPKPQPKKHGIRSLGDLINVVVAKVDKRENKIIEFTNTDDDEAVLTGLNLGVVRVKKLK